MFITDAVSFIYMIDGKRIEVCVEKKLYLECSVIFDNILNRFKKNGSYNAGASRSLYVCTNAEEFYESTLDIYMCNILIETWIFDLITRIEEYVINVFSVTVFHGAALEIANMNLLLMGERKAGKTTLAHHLVQKGWGLLDDDCIYYENSKVYGFGFPLRLRDFIYCEDKILTNSLDSEGNNRYFALADNFLEKSDKKKVIIFPQYLPTAKFKLVKLKKTDIFTSVLVNVRFSVSDQKTLTDVIQLIKDTVVAYKVTYSSCDDVNFFLKELIGNEFWG